jgi:large subunit ribosomal protein L9
MKVVFIKDLGGQAKVGEVKEVKPGYARNFLLPEGFAVLSSDPIGRNAIRQVELKKELEEKEVAGLKEKIASLGEMELIFSKKLTEKGGLFSAVKAQDIEKEFTSKTKITGAKVELEEPIKEAGEQTIEVKLAHGLSIFVTVKVKAEKK